MFPEILKIGAHSVKLRIREPYRVETDELGYADTAKNGIIVRNDMFESQIFATVLHEAMHIMNTTIDHALLSSLSEQLAQFFWDNTIKIPYQTEHNKLCQKD